MTRIVFETHATSEDNERGIATGWLPGRLSAAGRERARGLGARRREGFAAVFSSDLGRAVETVSVAFAGTGVPTFLDWRLRECNYGAMNGRPAAEVHGDRRRYLDTPHPGGESWREAVARVSRVFEDLLRDWPDARVLVVGHMATRWACEHVLAGVPLEELVEAEFVWQAGWDYVLEPATSAG